MGLSIAGLKKSSAIGGGTSGKSQGIFISKVIITDIKAHYDTKQKWQEAWQDKPDDLGIEMTLDIGRDFEPSFYIGGQLKRDEFGDKVGLGTCKKVSILFDSLDIDVPLTLDNLRIPRDILNDCVGRDFLRLSYVKGQKDDGKSVWSNWQETAKTGTDYNVFKESFLNAVSKKWVRNYEPNDDYTPSGNSVEDEELAL